MLIECPYCKHDQPRDEPKYHDVCDECQKQFRTDISGATFCAANDHDWRPWLPKFMMCERCKFVRPRSTFRPK